MNSSIPLVSIIIPCYNAEKWVADCIQSCLSQTYPNVEVIFVDDGSTDKSIEAVRSFQSPKIKIYQQNKLGACAARNKGLESSRGDYIQYLDADDLLSSNKIDEQIKLLSGFPGMIAACPTVPFWDGEKKLPKETKPPVFMSDTDSPAEFLIRMWGGQQQIIPGAVWTSAWLSPREVISAAGSWDSHTGPDDDGEYFCRVLLKSAGVRVAYRALNYHRAHRMFESRGSLTNKVAWDHRLYSIESKKRHLLEKDFSTSAKRAIAQCYLKLMAAVYPRFPEMAYEVLKRANALGIKNMRPYFDGRLARLICRLLGWKAASRYCIFKHQILILFKY